MKPAQELLFTRDHNVVGHRVGATFVLLKPGDWSVHVLNGGGARIWELLAAPVTLDAIATVLVREFEVEESRAREESSSFLTELRSRALLAPVLTAPSES